jgi:hypothetical protein
MSGRMQVATLKRPNEVAVWGAAPDRSAELLTDGPAVGRPGAPLPAAAQMAEQWPALPADIAGMLYRGIAQRGANAYSAVADLLLTDPHADGAALAWAATTEIGSLLRCKVTSCGLLAATSQVMVIGFAAQRMRRPAGDPVYLCFPSCIWTHVEQRVVAEWLDDFNAGLRELLDGRVQAAMRKFGGLAGLPPMADPMTRLLARRALALNIGYVVDASRASVPSW